MISVVGMSVCNWSLTNELFIIHEISGYGFDSVSSVKTASCTSRDLGVLMVLRGVNKIEFPTISLSQSPI